MRRSVETASLKRVLLGPVGKETRDDSQPHLSGYQRRDFEVVDYEMFQLGDSGLTFRGPMPDLHDPDGYFACLGAAQTLGCFVQQPFPTLLSREIGMPALNLGYGGAGPEFFDRQAKLDSFVNSARFVVLQVMSGRSQSNSLYECGGLEYVERRSDGRRLSAHRAFAEARLPGPNHIGPVRVPSRVRALVPDSPSRVQRRIDPLIQEIRANWVDSYIRLLRRIDVPVVLLWFSKRPQDYDVSYENAGGIFGAFPQLVTKEMVDEIRPLCTAFVECISDRGSPQPLISRFTGLPAEVDPANDRADLGFGTWTENRYYPSPEMHEDAALRLLPALREVLGRQ